MLFSKIVVHARPFFFYPALVSACVCAPQESRAAESEKQAKMKADRRDMAKRRAALCEELGRGC